MGGVGTGPGEFRRAASPESWGCWLLNAPVHIKTFGGGSLDSPFQRQTSFR